MRNVHCIEEAPAQAWLLRLKDGRLSGIAGREVKGGRDWLFEGGWAFTDTPRNRSPSGVYLGSGAVWTGRRLYLIAPSHSADAVYAMERRGEFFASNSLPFLLASAGISDFPITRIAPALLSLKLGLRKYQRCIHAGPEGRFYRYFNAIVRYDEFGRIRERQQKADLAFDSFQEYRDYLLNVIRQAGENYGSSEIAAFVSRGYDSVACAALAKEVGRTTAICVDQSRFGEADDGTEVARALGLPSVLLTRKQRQKVPGSRSGQELVSPADYADIFEFYIGMSLADECLRAPAELLCGRTVLTGFHGDKIWDPANDPSPDLQRGDSTGASLGEFRLRVGFLHIPVPMLTFRAHRRIRAIALSAEMEPWRLHTRYDRPIPRRIAEEAGVPREAFGQKKRHAAMLAENLKAVGPELFRMLVSRYEPAARALQTPPRRGWLASLAGRLQRGASSKAA